MIELSASRLPALLVKAAVAALLIHAGSMERAWPQSGAGMFSARPITTTSGAEIYRRICQGCHMPDGKGAIGAGRYPALAGDRALSSAQFMAITLLKGRRNMPAFGGNGDAGLFFSLPTLSDEQIAAVINYVRTNFGNRYKGPITAAEVKALRGPR